MQYIVSTIGMDGSDRSNELVVETAQKLNAQNYEFVSCYSGYEDGEIGKELKRLSSKVVFEEPIDMGKKSLSTVLKINGSVGTQIKRTIQTALEFQPDYVLYMEGDKPDFIKEIPKVIDEVQNLETDLMIVSRSKEGFAEFPFAQKLTENLFNFYAGLKTGIWADCIYGPKVFSRYVASTMSDYKPGDWGAITYPIFRASEEGKRINTMEVDGFPQQGYLKKYGNVNFMEHLGWRILQLIGSMNGARVGLKDGIKKCYDK